MLKKKVILFFLICALITPLSISVANSFLSIDTENYCLKLMQNSTEEDSEGKSKSKEKDKNIIPIDFTLISFDYNSNQLNVELLNSPLLHQVSDQPTPPPKF